MFKVENAYTRTELISLQYMSLPLHWILGGKSLEEWPINAVQGFFLGSSRFLLNITTVPVLFLCNIAICTADAILYCKCDQVSGLQQQVQCRLLNLTQFPCLLYIDIYPGDTTVFPKFVAILLLLSWLPNFNLGLKTLDWDCMWENSTFILLLNQL